jgi:hypothetical protein
MCLTDLWGEQVKVSLLEGEAVLPRPSTIHSRQLKPHNTGILFFKLHDKPTLGLCSCPKEVVLEVEVSRKRLVLLSCHEPPRPDAWLAPRDSMSSEACGWWRL